MSLPESANHSSMEETKVTLTYSDKYEEKSQHLSFFAFCKEHGAVDFVENPQKPGSFFGSTADGTRFALGSKLQSKDAINAVSDKDFIENYYFVEVRDKRFGNIYEKYLKDSGSKIYLSLIPDKNCFLAESSGHLSMDYDRLYQRMQEEMPYAEYIDITGLLNIEDYYKTDVHWRQEKIVDVADRIGTAMGITPDGKYETKTLQNDFYGVYFGQSALNLQGEKLHYLTNDVLEQCTVYNYENNRTLGVYDLEKAEGDDPYEIYLSGPVSLLKIENPNAKTEKELIVFRDSFGSSLVPLLAEGYRSAILVDIRYIQSDFLENFVDFTDKDVLFLYSTVVLTNSETLK